MRIVLLSLCLLLTLIFSIPAEAHFDEGIDGISENAAPAYPYDPAGETITAKFIFVAFPGDNAGQVVTLNEHQEAVNQYISYINSHSGGKLLLGPNSEILLHPGQALDANTPVRPSWEAELPSLEYRTGPCEDCVELPWDYEQVWGPRVSSWYAFSSSSSNRASELLAEIFWKIKTEYEEAGSDPFGEEVGVVVVIFQTAESPDIGAGGRPRIALNSEAINSETDFFSNLKVVNTEFAGTMAVQASASPVTDDFVIEKCVASSMHEFVHTLGPRDGPPSFAAMASLCGDGVLCEYRYYYGNQNLLSQHFVPGYGVPPIVLPVLETMPWFTEENTGVVDFTGLNLYGEKIYDIRGESGKIYKFRMGDYNTLGEEDFVLAYHSGQGVDAQFGELGGPVLPSQGLEIWHRVGNQMYDLESSIGNWDYAGENLDHYIYPADCNVSADVLSGYDNHDVWTQANGNSRNVQEYEDYIGENYDYFQVDLEGDDQRYNKDEFSFRSNPSSFGYNKNESSHEFLRRRPQDVPNSLVVKVIETGTDATGNYMVVDLLSAPGGLVLEPCYGPSPPVYELGDYIPIVWQHDEYNDAAETVDILFSKYGGEYYQEVLMENVMTAPGQEYWDWQPTAEHGTMHGRIKVVFKNSLSDHTNFAESSCEFVINTPMVVEEFIVSPNGGEVFSAGPSFSVPISWTNLLADIPGEDIDSVDLFFSTDGGVGWTEVEMGLTSPADYSVDPETGNNTYEMLLPDEMIGDQVKIRLDFHSGHDVVSQISESSFVVYSVEAIFTDISGDAGMVFQGEPYNAISIDYDSDEMLDLLISMQDVDGALEPRSELFKNVGLNGGGINFNNRTDYDFSPTSPAPINSLGLAAGDYDNYGGADVFITHESSPRLYQNSNGVLENKTNDPQVISAVDLRKLKESSCAVWVDYDHDSDLDLFVGRVSGVDGADWIPQQDFILINNGDGGFSGTVSIGSTVGYTSSAVWCDFNQDGLWEVVVGNFHTGPALALTTMYTENNAGGFTEVQGGFPAGFNPVGVASLNWTDFDRDGDLDLFVKRTTGDTEVLRNNEGQLTEVVTLFNEDSSWNSSTASPVDYNLDGWPDFILSDPLNTPQLRLLANFQGNSVFSDIDFGDISEAVGFSEISGPATGILSCDFNNDGDLDLFLGNIETGSSGNTLLLKNSQKGGLDNPANRRVSIDLQAINENTACLGAVVSVQTPVGDALGTQILDGGSGLGGQMPRILVFGLGDYSGDVVVSTHWPMGRVTTRTVSSAEISQGGVVAITADTDLQIFDSTIEKNLEFDPVSLLLHWTITWQTDFWSDKDFDNVTITRISGNNCGPDTVTLQSGDPDVVIQTPQYFVDPSTGQISFKHKVEWINQLCHPTCKYSVEVESSNGINSDSGTAGQTVYFKKCPAGSTQGGQ